jgi:hypothetical protein
MAGPLSNRGAFFVWPANWRKRDCAPRITVELRMAFDGGISG